MILPTSSICIQSFIWNGCYEQCRIHLQWHIQLFHASTILEFQIRQTKHLTLGVWNCFILSVCGGFFWSTLFAGFCLITKESRERRFRTRPHKDRTLDHVWCSNLLCSWKLTVCPFWSACMIVPVRSCWLVWWVVDDHHICTSLLCGTEGMQSLHLWKK